MTRYLQVKDIRLMTYAELQRWWETDFDVLMSTAVAEATGAVHPTVSAALCSEEWIDQWVDALCGATGELLSSVERMTYKRDGRLEKTREQTRSMTLRMQEANTALREHQKTNQQRTGCHSAKASVQSLIIRHHRQEFFELRGKEALRRGIPADHPFHGPDVGSDPYETIELGVAQGLLYAPVTDQIAALLKAPPHQITSLAARDISAHGERVDALRHPLMLKHWRSALGHLRDRHCNLAGVKPHFTITLPPIDWVAVSQMSDEEAWGLINRRRFIRAGAQRVRECRMHTKSVLKVVGQRQNEVRQPWEDAGAVAAEDLMRKYADQTQALLAVFLPFCLPDGDTLDTRMLPFPKREELIRELRTALDDGRWRNLLG